MENPLLLPAFPEYMAGFMMALEFTPRITRIAVELLSRAFGQLPDAVLVPWLPTLVVTLRPLGGGLMQTLIKEAGLAFPRKLGELEAWEFSWDRALPELSLDLAAPVAATATPGAAPTSAGPIAAAPAVALSPEEAALAGLLRGEPATLDALASRLGITAGWASTEASSTSAAALAPAGAGAGAAASPAAASAPAAPQTPVGLLLAEHPEALRALAARLGVG